MTPDHAFVIRGRDLSTRLDEPPIRIEDQLSVVERAVVPLVDADRDVALKVVEYADDSDTREGLNSEEGPLGNMKDRPRRQ